MRRFKRTFDPFSWLARPTVVYPFVFLKHGLLRLFSYGEVVVLDISPLTVLDPFVQTLFLRC